MRRGVSCVLVNSLFLASVLAPAILVTFGTDVAAQPHFHPGEELVIVGIYRVDEYEQWGDIVVTHYGELVVADGSRLVAESIRLEGNSVFTLAGGMVTLTNTSHRELVSISGECSAFEVREGSILKLDGPNGAYDTPSSMGCSVAINVTSSGTMIFEDSTVRLLAGDGFSPPEVLTEGDLDGRSYAGGSAELRLVMKEASDSLLMRNSAFQVRGGRGGDAPDGSVPPQGNRGAHGGGFTRGGDVAGSVGSGGDAVVELVTTDTVHVDSTFFYIDGGPGGDAGDGGTNDGAQAGGGGGGYTGGDGADGLGESPGPQPGGDVSGRVGAGGDVSIRVQSTDVTLRSSLLELMAGNAGDAGDGGGTGQGGGGGGGGGYSSGGGGSYHGQAGGDGGAVSGRVGAGGRAQVLVLADHELFMSDVKTQVWGGDGGQAGSGGSCEGVLTGGAGGGGYSGGGGGGDGPASGEAPGNPGGAGGELSGEVGSGGGALARFDSPRLVVMHSMVNIVGGDGGHGGLAGESILRNPGDYLSGGGGGGYSAGGGGGASSTVNQPCGEGGAAGIVYGQVGNGGDVEYSFSSDKPSIHQDVVMSNRIGWAGISDDTSAAGDVGGRGAGRTSMPGELRKYIPMSLPILWGPSDGAVISWVPVFDWMPVHGSTTDGAVLEYVVVVDDDEDFSSPVQVNSTNESMVDPGWIEMGQYYWRVYAVYGGPPPVPGPFSDRYRFRFHNAPPRITSEPRYEISERVPMSIYVGDFVDDPDNGISELSVNCTHYAVTSTLGLFIMFYYPKWVPTHTVEYLVSDGLNWVRGKITIVVLDINDAPKIETIDGLVVPVTIELEEGKEKRLVVNTSDLDGDVLKFDLRDSWPGASLVGNVLCLSAQAGELGWFRTTVVVSDGKGGSDQTRVRIHVVNAKQPPGPPEVFAPENHSKYKAGQPVSFTVKVTDPDIVWGETLTVTWASDVSGVLMSRVTTDTAGFSTSALPLGDHRITITVSDGTYSKSIWLDITIVEGDVGSGPPPEDSNWGIYLLGILLLGLMLLVGFAAGTRGVRDEV